MKLLGSVTSPYVRKVRIVMAEKKLDYELVQDDVWSADSQIQQSNPLGKVPCLVMEDGAAMFDSSVIAEYLDTLTPVGKLLPANSSRERAAVKCWEALADGVLDAAVLVRLERQRAAAQQSPDWIRRQHGKVKAGLKAMAAGLGEAPFCAGNHFTLADIAVGCALGWLAFRFPEMDWRGDHPNLARLADKLAERPSFQETAPR